MKAKIYVDKHFQIAPIDDRIYSSFIEHLGREVYGGIVDENSCNADENGFRTDVIDLVKEMQLKLVRYPGGNFVSALDWEDTIGPKEKRPVRFDITMREIEDNSFGLDEFLTWAEKANVEPMLCINLGTKGVEEARNIVEYCNFEKGTYYSDLRIQNGHEKPYGVKLWCLGNEMDGSWQVGQKAPQEYGKLANECAKVMKWVDPNIELVACGSSYYSMPSFGTWEAEVLEACYENVDYISLHSYYSNAENCPEAFLAKSLNMAKFIEKTAAICDYVGAKKKSDKVINISFDEWNVWDSTNHPLWVKPCCEKGEPRIEQDYTFEDALLVGSMLMTIINHCDRVKISCISELVNSIAPIKTAGDKAYRQTTYYPFALLSQYARGTALKSVVECDTYDTEEISNIPYVDCASVLQAENGSVVIAVLNRSLEERMELEVNLAGFASLQTARHITFNSGDLKATNTAQNPETVVPVEKANCQVCDGMLQVCLEPHSFNMFVIS